MRKTIIRKTLCIMIACVLIFSMAFPAFADTPAEDAHLHFDQNGRFRILNFSDFQGGVNLDARTKVFIRQAMYAASPDLVVLTGDNIFGKYVHGFDETRAAIAQFMDIFEALGVPVAIVFGNHDDEGDAILKDDQLEEIYSKYAVNISYDADVHLDGCGTYNVPIYGSTETNKVKFNLWMFDTGSYYPNDYMRENQLDWYENTSKKLQAANGGKVVPSIAFQHVIVKEIFNVLKTEGTHYVLPETAKPGSVMRETPSASRVGAEKEFSRLKQRGDVIAIVSGHDHRNSFVVPCDGIDLINTPAAGFYENKVYHGDDDTRGARVIDIYEPGVSNQPDPYRTEMMILREYPQPAYYYTPTSTGKYVKEIAVFCAETKQFGGNADAAMAAVYGSLYTAVDAANGNGVALWADLNAGSDILDFLPDSHTVICIGYTLTENPDEAMRHLALCYDDEEAYGWFVWWTLYGKDRFRVDDNGRAWTSIGNDLAWDPLSPANTTYDLNCETQGKQITFVANYDAADSPITELRIVNTGRNDTINMSAYPDYQLAHAVFGSETGPDVADLNKSAWGDYIYALYKTSDHALSRVTLNTLPLQDARFQAMYRMKTSGAVYPADCLANLQNAVAAADRILEDLQDDNTTSVYDQAAIDTATYQIEVWLHIQELKAASHAVTVTFDANGGECSEQSRTVLRGVAVGELPTAHKVQSISEYSKPTIYTFEGWFTEPEGGQQITPETIFAAAHDQTWYAHWSCDLPEISAKPNEPIPGGKEGFVAVEFPDQKQKDPQRAPMCADVNADGTVDLKDITLLTRHLAGGWDVQIEVDNADVNADGKVDLRDVVLMRRYLAGGWDVKLA